MTYQTLSICFRLCALYQKGGDVMLAYMNYLRTKDSGKE